MTRFVRVRAFSPELVYSFASSQAKAEDDETKMVLGRLVHYAADVLLVSTVLAGVKRETGFK